MESLVHYGNLLSEYVRWTDNYLQFENTIRLYRPVQPVRIEYLPFFEHMARQLTDLLKPYIGRAAKRYIVMFRTDPAEWQEKPYIIERIFEREITDSFACFPKRQYVQHTWYRGKFYRFHKDGYAYANLRVDTDTLRLTEDLWIRWKSNLPEYGYIEPDDGLALRTEDITFELCTEVPAEYIAQIFPDRVEAYDCGAWQRCLGRSKKSGTARKKKLPLLSVRVAEDCQYPDVVIRCAVKENNKEEAASGLLQCVHEFVVSQNEVENNEEKIPDVYLMEDTPDDEVAVFVDFGNCDPALLVQLLAHLEKRRTRGKKD